MSDLRKAAEMALDALEKPTYDGFGEWLVAMRNARDALRAALAELTDWEAVAADQSLTIALLRSEQTVPSDCPYSHQPQRKPLTDDAYRQLMKHAHRLANDGHGELAQYLRDAIDIAHGIGSKDE